MDPIERVLRQQAHWARSRGLELEGSSCARLEDNLFRPLRDATRAEFAAGAGDELGSGSKPGSMASLRSSAALAVNVFDAWRGSDLAALVGALGTDARVRELAFEQRFPTGLEGLPPHLDVVLGGEQARPTAIECKFTEPYGHPHNDFRPSYFARNDIWEGLGATRKLAGDIDKGRTEFVRLGAAQLIKHALGLRKAFGTGGFRLLYLWYGLPGEQAVLHRREIGEFAHLVGNDFDFYAMTYQELFSRLSGAREPEPGYINYLSDRYFSADSAPAFPAAVDSAAASPVETLGS